MKTIRVEYDTLRWFKEKNDYQRVSDSVTMTVNDYIADRFTNPLFDFEITPFKNPELMCIERVVYNLEALRDGMMVSIKDISLVSTEKPCENGGGS